ncbi:hypothetical protein Bca52824_011145 [Brassica carinata]|uniref:7-dehydrocholesterol reductase n=1 Tax=Brassica carinata TaxID=52824 RepID=A0A8X8BBD9_BRACI|nr:hypothetical protein Bca52824_011145 [Brassica carinata]
MAETVHSPIVTYASMLSLLTLCPSFDGSVVQTSGFLWENGVQGLVNIWPRPTAIAWKIIFCYGAFEAALQLLLPGKRVEGPDNGLAAYFVTIATYLGLWWFGIFNPAIVYDHSGEIFSALIFGSFIFCVLFFLCVFKTYLFVLYLGHVAPSSSDSGSCGNLIIDFYWGMELYPRIGKNFDIKVFTNCRFGMMSLVVLAVTYCIKQYEINGRVSDSMLVNTILMLVYVTKFFLWEAGYWNSMDIAHDRAGFYICWGCLVWVPCIYTSPGMYLVNHPVELGTHLAIYILVAGSLCIYINYDCDIQKNFYSLGWLQIVATYKTTASETKTSLLLTSGWWGLARHFHYVPEILSSFFWPHCCLNQFLPYFYVIYVTILLFHRLYCERVRYRIVPGIY